MNRQWSPEEMSSTPKVADERSGLKTVRRASQVLHAFADEATNLTLAMISRKVSLHKSIVHRLLVTLADEGLLSYDRESRTYRLGPGILRLASAIERTTPVIHEGGRIARRLADDMGHSVLLGVLEDLDLVYVQIAQGTGSLRVVMRTGDRRPPHISAAGKVLLAYAAASTVDAVIARGLLKFGPRTITAPRILRRELADVRRSGAAFNNEESAPGIFAVGVPVRSASGAVVAALSVSMPTHLVSRRDVNRALAKARLAADELSRALGWRAS